LSLSLRTSNLATERGFVSASTHWSWARICTMKSCLARIFSLMKKTSIFMWFVWLWNIGLWAIDITLWLSQKITRVVNGTYNSIRRAWIQVNSLEVWAKLWYYASVLDLVLTFCLQDHQDITFGPRNIATFEVERLSSTSDAQSASQNTWRTKGFVIEVGWRSRPWNKVPLRYHKILFHHY